MKLCWESLEHVVLMPSNLRNPEPHMVYYDDFVNLSGSHGEVNISDQPCLYCGEYFLHSKKDKSFCDCDCRSKYIENKMENKNAKTVVKIDKRLRKNGGGQHLIGNSYTPRIRMDDNTVRFDAYNDKLSWFTDAKRNDSDNTILDVRCCVCGKWFSPYHSRIKSVLKFVNDTKNRDRDSWGFYCSDQCKGSCKYFGKTTEQIMKDDYLNNGKAKYSEIHKIPDKVLYYDWKDDLKVITDAKQEVYTRKKMRRRKKREFEIERIRKKKEKQEKPKHEKSSRELRLKRMLYLSKQRSKIKNIEHDIDYEWLLNNTPESCPKCGIEFSYDLNIKMNPFAPSIDRVDSNKGYTKDNCRVVSWMYNCGKSTYTDDVLYIICKAVIDNNVC